MILARSFPLGAAFATALATAVSGGNLDTVKSIYGAFGSGDVPMILAQMSPDVEWDWGWDNSEIPVIMPRHGPDEVAGFFQGLSGMEFTQFDIRSLLESDNEVAAMIEVGLVVKETGKTMHDYEVHLWTFDADGKVTRFRHFLDTAQFAAALQN